MNSDCFSKLEIDAIGEILNISLGASATAVSTMLSARVDITTPIVNVVNKEEFELDRVDPAVCVEITYVAGLEGQNVMLLKRHDIKVIVEMAMGMEIADEDFELDEINISAVCEVMNQMMGAAATSLSTMMGKMIDISPPDASLIDLNDFESGEDIATFLKGTFVKISFRMQIDDLVDSSIMQLYPIDFARKVVDTFMNSQSPAEEKKEEAPVAAPSQAAGQQPSMNQMGGAPQMDMNAGANAGYGAAGMTPQMDPNAMMNMGGMQMGMNPQMMNMGGMQMGAMGMNPQMMNMGGMQMGMNPQMMNMGMPGGAAMNQQAAMQNINVQPAQFQSFSSDGSAIAGQENIGLIMDVPLNVTVELGRTSKSISEILDFAPGSIIELDRIAGEPIDVLVNGKLVAKGEVVVIEECFSVRITEIIK